jgi:hypothetical protein
MTVTLKRHLIPGLTAELILDRDKEYCKVRLLAPFLGWQIGDTLEILRDEIEEKPQGETP